MYTSSSRETLSQKQKEWKRAIILAETECYSIYRKPKIAFLIGHLILTSRLGQGPTYESTDHNPLGDKPSAKYKTYKNSLSDSF